MEKRTAAQRGRQRKSPQIATVLAVAGCLSVAVALGMSGGSAASTPSSHHSCEGPKAWDLKGHADDPGSKVEILLKARFSHAHGDDCRGPVDDVHIQSFVANGLKVTCPDGETATNDFKMSDPADFHVRYLSDRKAELSGIHQDIAERDHVTSILDLGTHGGKGSAPFSLDWDGHFTGARMAEPGLCKTAREHWRVYGVPHLR